MAETEREIEPGPLLLALRNPPITDETEALAFGRWYEDNHVALTIGELKALKRVAQAQLAAEAKRRG